MDKKKSWQDNQSWSSTDADITKEKEEKQKEENKNPNDHGFLVSIWNTDGTGVLNRIGNWFKRK